LALKIFIVDVIDFVAFCAGEEKQNAFPDETSENIFQENGLRFSIDINLQSV
jgi:hypothetical protein